MRVPDQAPALVRNHRAHPARRSGGGSTDAYGVSPSQYDGEGEEGEGAEGGEGGEGAEDEGGDSGGGDGNEADSSVESEG
jgi:hypothetical protein